MKKKNIKVNKVKDNKKKSKTTKKENVLIKILKKVKKILLKLVSIQYNVSVLDILLLVVVVCVVASCATGYIMNKEFEQNIKINSVVSENGLDKFISVYNEVLTKYYEEVDSGELIDAGIKGMISHLKDKYAIYVDEDVISDDLDSSYEGIGVVTVETTTPARLPP